MAFKPEFVDLITARRAALRAQLNTILPEPRPIVLELGCGHGHFLEQYAKEFPATCCLGVDLSSERIGRALRKAQRANLPNCHFIRAEARELLYALPANVALEEIWVLFPDPWPKKRHHKNRLMQPEFFELMANRAGEGTRLYFRTDFAPYFEAVVEFLPDLKTWQPTAPAPWPLEPETVFQARALEYHSLTAVRTTHPAKREETTAPGLPPRANPTSAA